MNNSCYQIVKKLPRNKQGLKPFPIYIGTDLI